VTAAARNWVRSSLVRGTRRLAERLHFDMIYRNYYSPIPQVDELPPETWERPNPVPGISLSAEDQLRYLEELSPFLAEFSPPVRATAGSNGYFLDNISFGPVDADVLYGTIRHAKPRRVMELGAGWSTLVSAQACRANAAEGHPTELIAVDPFPQPFLSDTVEGLSELRVCKATEVAVEEMAALAPGDILFVDTTHTVKVGSEVNYLILEVLPQLQSGVIVHFHDIFLPFEYPRAWLEERGYYWAEQYLLQAFLACNPHFDVLFASHYLARTQPERLRELIPAAEATDKPPASIWLRRRP
jgi:predicted O-methyltransferase YrrM